MADQAQFEADAMQYAPQLFAAAMRMTRNRADAEDVVQETFLKAYRAYDSFEAGPTSKLGCTESSRTRTSTGIARKARAPMRSTSETSKTSTCIGDWTLRRIPLALPRNRCSTGWSMRT